MTPSPPLSEDDQDTFYESLDRILSSSTSSTSTPSSDTSDTDTHLRPPNHHHYDVWTSPDSFLLPSSLRLRRLRLFLSLGLHPPSTVNTQQFHNNINHNHIDDIDIYRNKNNEEKQDELHIDRNKNYEEKEDDEEVEQEEEKEEEEDINSVCRRIKDLDNGKEFVVNEGKMKEVGTGRQLTMEEFETAVLGHSPIVQELMRRHNSNNNVEVECNQNRSKKKKRVSWFRSIMKASVVGERRSSDDKDTSSERGGRRSSSATDDSQDGGSTFSGPERVRVRHYGKSVKDLTALYKSQEIQAHNGSIWAIRFSVDGRFLASAGEDCVIHVWQVVETERKGELLVERPDDGGLSLLLLSNGSPEPSLISSSLENPLERRRKGRTSISRKSVSLDHIVVPETVFGLSEKPFCSFQGHSDDVLDLSWSKSQVCVSHDCPSLLVL